MTSLAAPPSLSLTSYPLTKGELRNWSLQSAAGYARGKGTGSPGRKGEGIGRPLTNLLELRPYSPFIAPPPHPSVARPTHTLAPSHTHNPTPLPLALHAFADPAPSEIPSYPTSCGQSVVWWAAAGFPSGGLAHGRQPAPQNDRERFALLGIIVLL